MKSDHTLIRALFLISSSKENRKSNYFPQILTLFAHFITLTLLESHQFIESSVAPADRHLVEVE